MDATEVLAAVLVLVTAYYAWQNRQMVKEMAAARSVSVMPKLAIEWTMATPTLGIPTVKNVGPGPALDVDLAVRFVPLAGKEDKEDVRQWVASAMVPDEEKQFLPPQNEQGSMMHTEALAATYASVVLTASYRDALGKEHSADDFLADIAEWRRVTGEALGRWQEPDFAKRLANEIGEKLGEKKLVPALKGIAKKLGQ